MRQVFLDDCMGYDLSGLVTDHLEIAISHLIKHEYTVKLLDVMDVFVKIEDEPIRVVALYFEHAQRRTQALVYPNKEGLYEIRACPTIG